MNGVASFLHRDALSSVRAVSGAGGGVSEAAVYRPYGEQQEWVLDASAAGEDKGFIGERYDADAGLQYLNARYYDPRLGLFLQPDWWEGEAPTGPVPVARARRRTSPGRGGTGMPIAQAVRSTAQTRTATSVWRVR